MNCIDLFAGAGGFSTGATIGWPSTCLATLSALPQSLS